MKIRTIQKPDISQVSVLIFKLTQYVQELSQDPYFRFQRQPQALIEKKLKENIINPLKRIYVAQEDEKIVAFISGEIQECYLPISNINKIGYIDSAYTLPEYRKKGLNKQLEKKISKYFHENGVEFVELHVMLQNKEALKAWEKMGYNVFRLHLRKKLF